MSDETVAEPYLVSVGALGWVSLTFNSLSLLFAMVLGWHRGRQTRALFKDYHSSLRFFLIWTLFSSRLVQFVRQLIVFKLATWMKMWQTPEYEAIFVNQILPWRKMAYFLHYIFLIHLYLIAALSLLLTLDRYARVRFLLPQDALSKFFRFSLGFLGYIMISVLIVYGVEYGPHVLYGKDWTFVYPALKLAVEIRRYAEIGFWGFGFALDYIFTVRLIWLSVFDRKLNSNKLVMLQNGKGNGKADNLGSNLDDTGQHSYSSFTMDGSVSDATVSFPKRNSQLTSRASPSRTNAPTASPWTRQTPCAMQANVPNDVSEEISRFDLGSFDLVTQLAWTTLQQRALAIARKRKLIAIRMMLLFGCILVVDISQITVTAVVVIQVFQNADFPFENLYVISCSWIVLRVYSVLRLLDMFLVNLKQSNQEIRLNANFQMDAMRALAQENQVPESSITCNVSS